jgi:hypothetical protein
MSERLTIGILHLGYKKDKVFNFHFWNPGKFDCIRKKMMPLGNVKSVIPLEWMSTRTEDSNLEDLIVVHLKVKISVKILFLTKFANSE